MKTTMQVYIPQYVMVHLGKPGQPAHNYQIGFVDYIKNVASCKLCPSWDETALRASIYTYITLTLERILTKHYRKKSYGFDVTNSGEFDLPFVPGRDIYETVTIIVDEIFNGYIANRDGELLLEASTPCSGRGVLDLAKQGCSVEQILQNFYAEEIAIAHNPSVQGIPKTFIKALKPSKLAASEVSQFQEELNAISDNYPIPKLKKDGVYGEKTETAVKAFQNIFNLRCNGIVDQPTWFCQKRAYQNTKQLSDLQQEGIKIENFTRNSVVLRKGMQGFTVKVLQYYLNMIAYFNETIHLIKMDGSFGRQTHEAVIAFQKSYHLVQDGVVGIKTWSKLENLFENLVETFPFHLENDDARYPIAVLKKGMMNNDVAQVQRYVLPIKKTNRQLWGLTVTGIYDDNTVQAVKIFQKTYGLHQTGCVGPITLRKLKEVYA